MQMADNKVAAMEDEMNKKIGAAKCEVEAASDDSRTTVLAEMLYTALVTAKREVDHKKEMERQSLVHNSKIKAKDYEISKVKQQTEKYCGVSSAANVKVRELALKNILKVDELKIQHKARVQGLQSKHVAVIEAKKRDITQLRAWTRSWQTWMNYVLHSVVPPLRMPYHTSFPSIHSHDSAAVLYPSSLPQ